MDASASTPSAAPIARGSRTRSRELGMSHSLQLAAPGLAVPLFLGVRFVIAPRSLRAHGPDTSGC